MISSRHITGFISVIMTAAVCLCLILTAFGNQLQAMAGGTGVTMEYETKLFDTDEILTINIMMDEDSWNEMLESAMSEEYYQCDVEINGTTFYNVAIRPKGNTSLSSIAEDPDTDRCSFKLEFDHYVEGQTCFGLDKLILNNDYADATNMKEALVYDMFQYIGADASLYNYAKIEINGEYWGLYLALEGVEDSFLTRNYGVQNGALYKPEGMGMGGGFENSSGGADLNYTDDDLDSYDTIWDGSVTETGKADRKRVIAALKNISEGSDLEDSMDTDNLLRYMAVHTFVVNEDSLSGSMAHNYYLYESDGKLNIIPWDYNLSLGGMNMGGGPGQNHTDGATSIVNDAIDDSWDSTNFFDALLNDEQYCSQYHEYLLKLVNEYVEGGGFEAFYERVRSQIDSLVETDPTAFYTYEEYETAAKTLYQIVQLRAESVKGQIEGTIPSTSDEQRSSDALIDASSIDTSVMGTMMNGGGGHHDPSDGESNDAADEQPQQTKLSFEESSEEDDSSPQRPAQQPDKSKSAENESVEGDNPSGFSGDSENDDFGKDFSGDFNKDFPGGPGGDFPGDSVSGQEDTTVQDNLILYGICFAVMAAALLFAVLYRRRPRKR